MKHRFDPEVHRRRSLRLKGYDYSRAGAYFVTIVAQDRLCLFGEVVDGEMRLNEAGMMVRRVWRGLPDRFSVIDLDASVVMPNHVHGIIVIDDAELATPVRASIVDVQHGDEDARPTTRDQARDHRATTRVAPTGGDQDVEDERGEPIPRAGATTSVAVTLGDVVGAFKSLTTNEYGRGVRGMGWSPFNVRLWQRNYYERVIRNDDELDGIREYIMGNPAGWDADEENPDVDRGRP